MLIEQIQHFLSAAAKDNVKISEEYIEEFGEQCKAAIRKQFTKQFKREFKLRMSNIGRPLCQLQMEAMGEEPEPPTYNVKMRSLFGDLVEAAAILVIKSAGIDVKDIGKRVSTKVEDEKINGVIDIETDEGIWDVKSMSDAHYKKLEFNGFTKFYEEDYSGYLIQGFLYGKSEAKKFRGFIIINKSTGEWQLLETPEVDEHHNQKYLEQVKYVINNINKPFKRCFEDKPERKGSANRVLGLPCTFCNYKFPCWKNLDYRKDPETNRWKWYTHYAQ